MLGMIRKLMKGRRGAVTVDFVVLTGAVVVIAGAAVAVLSENGIGPLIADVSTNLGAEADTQITVDVDTSD